MSSQELGSDEERVKEWEIKEEDRKRKKELEEIKEKLEKRKKERMMRKEIKIKKEDAKVAEDKKENEELVSAVVWSHVPGSYWLKGKQWSGDREIEVLRPRFDPKKAT